MDRRDFVKVALGGVAGSLVAPQAVMAEAAQALAGNVYYTKAQPGRWAKKAGGHLPAIEVGNGKMRVTTGHEMKDYEHYIVKHQLFDKDFNLLGERLFDPKTDKAPISEYDLKGYSGPLYATSMCNKHDVWLNEAMA